MDIDLLAKMVKNLILDNERVVLPGLGCFVAELVPSTFSDKGYTINPPYRRLYFRSKPDEGNELIEFYANSNNIPVALADNVIRDFLSEMKEVLFMKKTVVFPGLGRLRATKENDIFFVADEDLDIYPAGFGLEPVSLKTHQESPEQVSKAVGSLKSILDEPAETPAPVEEQPVSDTNPEEQQPAPAPQQPVEQEPAAEVADDKAVVEPTDAEAPRPMPQPAPVEQPAPVQEEVAEEKDPQDDAVAKSSKMKIVLIVLACIIGAAIAFFVIFQVLAVAFPEWMDSLLYSQEELEILNKMYE
jgi:hypothetical protein